MSANGAAALATVMATRDGVGLSTDVYLPDGHGPWPALLMRTPYGKEAMGPRYGAADISAGGIAVVVQDVRGTSTSDGRYAGLGGDGADGYDSVEWTAGQSWCTGRVGMFGPSAMGATQWSAAQLAPPHLVAIAPEVIAMDESQRWGFRLETQLMFALGMARNGLIRDRDRWSTDRYRDRLAALDEALSDPREVLGRLPVTDQPVLEGLVSSYSERADEGPALGVGEIDYGAIAVPAYIVAGWFDFTLSGCVNQYRGMRLRAGTAQAREGSRLLVGPYFHGVHGEEPSDRPEGWCDVAWGASARTEEARPRWLSWMDPYLRAQDAGPGRGGNAAEAPRRVRIFTMGSAVWREIEDFPPPDATAQRWYLASSGAANHATGDGALRACPPGAGTTPDSFDYDPLDPVPSPGDAKGGVFDVRALLARGDILVYGSDPLREEVEATGPVSVTLSVATSAHDTDFTATLLDIGPDAAAQTVADNLLRLRYRNGGGGGGGGGEEPVEPGRIYRITIDLIALSTCFGVGHRIAIAISSSNFPLWDRNPNTGEPMHASARTVVARQTVFHDEDHPSYLTLPVRTAA